MANPIVASSGALGFGNGYWWDKPLITTGIIKPECLGAVITKTLTLEPWRGNWRGWNLWQVLRPIRGGWVNAVGLTNKGLEWFMSNEYPAVNHSNLIVSITDPEPQRIISMVGKLNKLEMMAIEINLSCPNTPQWADLQRSPKTVQGIFSKVRHLSRHPLVAKIGYLPVPEREQIAEALTVAGVDAVDMINTIPFGTRYPGQRSPLSFGGGISGHVIRKYALEQVSWFSLNTSLPIIGGGGVKTIKDVKIFLDAGADAVAIGSAHLVRPWISSYLASQFTRVP
jgi:dihydroorotate dehydrogenase (NAD+) catalytic subunit